MKQSALIVFLSSLLYISCHYGTVVAAFHLPAATTVTTSTSERARASASTRISACSKRPTSTNTYQWRSKELSSSRLFSSSSNNNNSINNIDPIMRKVAIRLRRANWISWWAQVVLTVISSITLLFARSVLNAVSLSTSAAVGIASSQGPAPAPPGGFLFAGAGIVLSYLSIIWTWGGTRLSRRIFRSSSSSSSTQSAVFSSSDSGSGGSSSNNNNNNNKNKTTKIYSRIKAATTIRRAILIGTMLNLLGMFVTLIGAEQIVGLLAARVLTAQGGFGLGLGGGGFSPLAAGVAAQQTIQPLDVLIVQANTNTLLSHFLSLVCCLVLTRSVHDLDPPSVEDDER